MSEAKKQVLIVSLYDRGFYLSNELAEQGHNVTLLNLPYKNDQSDFWSNPFGFFKNEALTYNQKYYLEGPSTSHLERGLSLWLNEGPIDFKTEFSKQILDSRGASKDWVEPFSKSIFSTTNNLDKFKASKAETYNFELDYLVKNSSVQSIQHEIKNTERLGVKLLSAKLSKISKTEDKKSSVLVGGETLVFDKIICLLSSYECSLLCKELLDYVYKGRTLYPEWVWLNTKFDFEPCDPLELMPEHFVVLDDVDTIWAYKNLLFVKKDNLTNSLEVSFRWPFNERANLSYINDELMEIKEFFESKIKNIKLKVRPLVEEELAPFYVYDEVALKQFNNELQKNKYIIPFGPELWLNWDLMSIMKQQYSLTMEGRLNHD